MWAAHVDSNHQRKSGQGQIDLLALDIDLRLCEVIAAAWEHRDRDAGGQVALLRLAYGTGYSDALLEPVRGLLYSDNGFVIPQRAASLSRPRRFPR